MEIFYFTESRGSSNDKTVFGKILVEFKKQINFESIMGIVIYSLRTKLIKEFKMDKPGTFSLKLAKNLVQSLNRSQLELSPQKGYSYCRKT